MLSAVYNIYHIIYCYAGLCNVCSYNDLLRYWNRTSMKFIASQTRTKALCTKIYLHIDVLINVSISWIVFVIHFHWAGVKYWLLFSLYMLVHFALVDCFWVHFYISVTFFLDKTVPFSDMKKLVVNLSEAVHLDLPSSIWIISRTGWRQNSAKIIFPTPFSPLMELFGLYLRNIKNWCMKHEKKPLQDMHKKR